MSESETETCVCIKTVPVRRSRRATEQVPRKSGSKRTSISSTLRKEPPAQTLSGNMTSGNILTLCLWICLLYCCYTVTQGELAVDCCLSVSYKPIPAQVVRGYMRQDKGNGCDHSAVVFITRKNIRLCAPPEAAWVKNLISNLNNLLKKCKAKKFQGRKCDELKSVMFGNSVQ
ncbi:C-C motif chemokine 19a.1 [Scleropages formosus]|uniref:C-C motif chemokine n=1 Tax=Scleropages formosus TaxID=113540 RepID=A0A8D0CF50_SCLFO|nr:C-C motif chemokine 19-like [Scleropages formosus]